MSSWNAGTEPAAATSTNPPGTSAPQPQPTSSGNQPSSEESHPRAKFDEKNILETFHPANKDYGFMHIDEAKTPYVHDQEPKGDKSNSGKPKQASMESGSKLGNFDPHILSQMLLEKGHEPPKSVAKFAGERDFENQRKNHYNEFQSIQLAKELIAEERDDLSEAEPVMAASVSKADSKPASKDKK